MSHCADRLLVWFEIRSKKISISAFVTAYFYCPQIIAKLKQKSEAILSIGEDFES